MRHRKKINHLGRQKAHRHSMLSNMAASLIIHKRIQTTVAKAKALKSFVEPLITKSKDDTTHSRRIVFSYLQDKQAVTELFRDVAVKIADRPGGYTRILKTGMRIGDNADMCFIELVDYNELMLDSADKKDKKTSRRRRGAKKGKTEEIQSTQPKEVKTEPNKQQKPEVKEIIEEVQEEQISEEINQPEEPVNKIAEQAEVQPEEAEVAIEEPVVQEQPSVTEEPVADNLSDEVAEEPAKDEETEDKV